jgi:hypothetical protein
MGVLARDTPAHQGLDRQIRDRIIRRGQLGKRSVEILESAADDGASELGDPTEVMVNGHRRQTGGGRYRTSLYRRRPQLG